MATAAAGRAARSVHHDVLDRYRAIGDGTSADANVFYFYQMRIELRRA